MIAIAGALLICEICEICRIGAQAHAHCDKIRMSRRASASGSAVIGDNGNDMSDEAYLDSTYDYAVLESAMVDKDALGADALEAMSSDDEASDLHAFLQDEVSDSSDDNDMDF